MTNYYAGDYVVICSLMIVAKIVSVRNTHSTTTLWVEHNGSEFPISALKGSDIFVIKGHSTHKTVQESKVMKLSTLIHVIGFITLGLALLIYFGN